MTVTEFLKQACKNANYSFEKVIFIVTKDAESFDACRKFVTDECIAHAKASIPEESLDEIEVEPVKTLWIQVNDEYTPRGHSAVAALVNEGLQITDGCLRAMNNAMLVTKTQSNLMAEDVWMQTYFDANLE